MKGAERMDFKVEPCGDGYVTVTINNFDFTVTERQFDHLFLLMYEYDMQKKMEALCDAMEGEWK